MMQKAVAKVTEVQIGIKAIDDAKQCMTDLQMHFGKGSKLFEIYIKNIEMEQVKEIQSILVKSGGNTEDKVKLLVGVFLHQIHEPLTKLKNDSIVMDEGLQSAFMNLYAEEFLVKGRYENTRFLELLSTREIGLQACVSAAAAASTAVDDSLQLWQPALCCLGVQTKARLFEPEIFKSKGFGFQIQRVWIWHFAI